MIPDQVLACQHVRVYNLKRQSHPELVRLAAKKAQDQHLSQAVRNLVFDLPTRKCPHQNLQLQ